MIINLFRRVFEGTGGEIGLTAIHGGIVLPIDGAADGDGAAGVMNFANAYAVLVIFSPSGSDFSDGVQDGDVATGRIIRIAVADACAVPAARGIDNATADGNSTTR